MVFRIRRIVVEALLIVRRRTCSHCPLHHGCGGARHQRQYRHLLCIGLCVTLFLPLPSLGNEQTQGEQSVRLYRTREEQREAGLNTQLTPWLNFSGLLEFEAGRDDDTFSDGLDRSTSDSEIATQLAFIVTPLEFMQAELILEHDTDRDEIVADELTLALDIDDFELLVGRQYLPFGEFFSRFVTGPSLEFGETRDTAITLVYDRDDRLEVSGSVYQGPARVRADGNRFDWAAALEVWPSPSLAIGLSYLSDLADTDERLLAEEGNLFERKVAGASAYVLWLGNHYELTFEALGAIQEFREFERDADRPRAWNLELAMFVHPKVDLALRVARSRELEDAPNSQYGLAMTFLLHRRSTLTFEYLYSRFPGDGDAEEPEPTRSHRLAGQLSIAF